MLVVVVAIGACATTGTTKFTTSAHAVAVPPVTRLVVFETVESPFFNHQMHRGFVVGLTKRMASCGVEASVEHLSELELDRDQRRTSAVTAARAGAMLMIDAAGGKRTVSGNSSNDVLRFDLRLVDVATKQVPWSGEANLERLQSWATDELGSGAQFATALVERMRDDGVLTRCPAKAASWPAIDASKSDVPEPNPDTAHFNSRLEDRNAAPAKRLVVYDDLTAPPVGYELHDGLAGELGRRFDACGLLVHFTSAARAATDDAELLASVRAFEADSVLVVRRIGGNIPTGDPHEGDLIVDLRLIDLVSAKLVWRGRARLDLPAGRTSTESTTAGKRFGAEIVARLRDDHALAGCPR